MKRFISTVLAGCLILAVTACNNQHDDRIDPTTRTTESKDNRGYSEPTQSIAESVVTTETESSETATTTQSGSYTYEAYGFTFTMDVNIDDYIHLSPYTGDTYFDMYELAEDYGWKPHRANGDDSYTLGDVYTVMWYEYEFENGKVMVLETQCAGSSSNSIGKQHLSYLHYSFCETPTGYMSMSNFYDDKDKNPLHESISITFANLSSDVECVDAYGTGNPSGGHPEGAVSREDIIFLAFFITVGSQHPGENPFYYCGDENIYHPSSYDIENQGRYVRYDGFPEVYVNTLDRTLDGIFTIGKSGIGGIKIERTN